MLTATITKQDTGESHTAYGTSHEIFNEIIDLHPEFRQVAHDLPELVLAVNQSQNLRIVVAPVSQGSNRLPDDYLTQDQGDDPWPRAADKNK